MCSSLARAQLPHHQSLRLFDTQSLRLSDIQDNREELGQQGCTRGRSRPPGQAPQFDAGDSGGVGQVAQVRREVVLRGRMIDASSAFWWALLRSSHKNIPIVDAAVEHAVVGAIGHCSLAALTEGVRPLADV